MSIRKFQFLLVRLRAYLIVTEVEVGDVIFQFLLVRLRAQRAKLSNLVASISIPSGAIKRYATLHDPKFANIFQFLLVRLRARNTFLCVLQALISIPSGAIKSKYKHSKYSQSFSISIPSGAIKRVAGDFRGLSIFGISIPSGAIKRPERHPNIVLTCVFQFLLVRLRGPRPVANKPGAGGFQFLLVRLRGLPFTPDYYSPYISIPSGTIKSGQ